MTEKRLNFPSMGDPNPSESSDTFIKNESGEYERFIPDDLDDDHSDELGDLDADDTYKSNDATLDGEQAAFSGAMELIGSEDGFSYFPSDAAEQNNRKFCIQQLQQEFGADTRRNIGIARWFMGNFLEDDLIRQAHHTGIGSHPLMVKAFYNAARRMEKLALKRMRGESEVGKSLKFKGMDGIVVRNLENDAREMASRVYSDATAKIIAKHGGIHHR